LIATGVADGPQFCAGQKIWKDVTKHLF